MGRGKALSATEKTRIDSYRESGNFISQILILIDRSSNVDENYIKNSAKNDTNSNKTSNSKLAI